MILIAGIPSEPPVRLAIQSAEAADIDHVVLNQRRVHEMQIEVSAEPASESSPTGIRAVLQTPDDRIDLEALRGVYWRLMDSGSLPENGPDAQESARTRSLSFHDALLAWVDTAGCRVANRIGPMGSNASKPFQAQLIERVGLATPDTLISTVPDRVTGTQQDWGQLVYKSISSVRSIVRTLAESDDLDDIRVLPTQFQRTVPGTDVRVHVVGEDVHATEITSDAVDYRYAGRDGMDADLRPIELPLDVADRCRALSRQLELPFCGIDLRRISDDDWVCFEVNPSPGYSYYQQQTGQPISDSLVRWLDAGTSMTAGNGRS